MTRSEKAKFVVVRTVGNFLVLFSLYGVVATFGPALTQEARFRIIQFRGVHYTVEAQSPSLSSSQMFSGAGGFREVLAGKKDQILIPKDPDFSIVIPKIGASAKVYPNVDTTNQSIFLPILQKGVAHAKGTVFPGMNGNVYLFAHSTDNWWNVGRYNAVFYLLKDLGVGDDIIVFFEGRRYNYTVRQTLTADPSEVSYLVNSRGASQRLILQTCWPPGTTWKRIFVIAEPKGM